MLQNNEPESNKNFIGLLKYFHLEYQPRYFEMLKGNLLELKLHPQSLFGVIVCYSFIFYTLNQFKVFRNHKYFESTTMRAFRINDIEKTYWDLSQEIALIESYINNYKDSIENYNKFNFRNFITNNKPRKPPTEVKNWLDTIYLRWKMQK